jgi:septum formation topological specificity factor MinE
MAAYCTVEDVLTLLQADAGAVSYDLLNILVEEASRSIDKYCRRSFEVIAAERLYDWPSDGVLRFRQDLLSVVSITTNADQEYDHTEVHLKPQGGPPFLSLVPIYSKPFRYSGTPVDAIRVTGQWGYAESVPEPVRVAAMLWVADAYARSDVPAMSSVTSGEIKSVMLPELDKPPLQAQARLNRYVRRTILSAEIGSPNRAQILA